MRQSNKEFDQLVHKLEKSTAHMSLGIPANELHRMHKRQRAKAEAHARPKVRFDQKFATECEHHEKWQCKHPETGNGQCKLPICPVVRQQGQTDYQAHMAGVL